jgi:hypothetical protein
VLQKIRGLFMIFAAAVGLNLLLRQLLIVPQQLQVDCTLHYGEEKSQVANTLFVIVML